MPWDWPDVDFEFSDPTYWVDLDWRRWGYPLFIVIFGGISVLGFAVIGGSLGFGIGLVGGFFALLTYLAWCWASR